ncbi:MAG: DUF4351 domain-containing protein [Planctomycetota bacterium]
MEARTETEPERLREVLALRVDRATLEVIMSAADKLRAEGRQAGLAEGRQAGLAERRQAGLAEGRRAGLLEGRRALLRRQLERRFGRLPEEVVHRLDNASSPEMDLWADRVLDAPTLENMFRS